MFGIEDPQMWKIAMWMLALNAINTTATVTRTAVTVLDHLRKRN